MARTTEKQSRQGRQKEEKMKVTEMKYDALMEAANSLVNEKAEGIARISKVSHRGEPLRFGVNWSAIGATTPEEAIRFAEVVSFTAEIVNVLNAMDMQVDRQFEDDGDFQQAVNELKDALLRFDYGDVEFLVTRAGNRE